MVMLIGSREAGKPPISGAMKDYLAEWDDYQAWLVTGKRDRPRDPHEALEREVQEAKRPPRTNGQGRGCGRVFPDLSLANGPKC
jgi:hypothetical protein